MTGGGDDHEQADVDAEESHVLNRKLEINVFNRRKAKMNKQTRKAAEIDEKSGPTGSESAKAALASFVQSEQAKPPDDVDGGKTRRSNEESVRERTKGSNSSGSPSSLPAIMWCLLLITAASRYSF